MKARRRDFARREYDEVEIADTCCNYSSDMDKTVTCPGCGCDVRYGDTFTSRRFHDSVGFGYGVCEACHEREFLDRSRASLESGVGDE